MYNLNTTCSECGGFPEPKKGDLMGAYKYIKQTMISEYKGIKDTDYDYKQLYRQRLIEWRRDPAAITLIERPTNIVRAKELGYKAKQGIYVARIKVRKGSGMHVRPNKGRKPHRMGTVKKTRIKSIQTIAEERVNSAFPYFEVLNSYLVGEDGQRKYYEVILVDPYEPAIATDKELSWIVSSKHSGRVFRGKTSSARKSRGLMYRGKGVEKARPSVRAHNRKARQYGHCCGCNTHRGYHIFLSFSIFSTI